MAGKTDYTVLVDKAREGNRESADKLADLIRPQLSVYLYRLTLDSHLTEDICQESLLEMFRFMSHLKSSQNFWPWLRRIALNKLYLHFNSRKKSQEVPLPSADQLPSVNKEIEGLTKMISDEWKESVLAAMHQLKPRHRQVLVMRCFENMDYAEIARDMGCSEFGTRMLFHRAKKACSRQLAKRGIKKKYLLGALALFAYMTASVEGKPAANTVSIATLKVGTAAAMAEVVTSKSVLIGSLIILTTMGAVLTPGIKSFLGGDNGRTASPGGFYSSLESGARQYEEQIWYYFPQGSSGAVITKKMVRSEIHSNPQCLWLQDGKANYIYQPQKHKVYLTNHKPYSKDAFSAFLPTDTFEFTEWLSRYCHRELQHYNRIDSRQKDLVIISSYNIAEKQHDYFVTQHHNILSEEYFKYAWPKNTEMIDTRDTLHQQGYGWFVMDIEVGKHRGKGVGRIPFVYEASKEYPGILEIGFDNGIHLGDKVGQSSWMSYPGSDGRMVFEGGRFFEGFSRPWTGLHTLDCLRRDATTRMFEFETEFYHQDRFCKLTLEGSDFKVRYVVNLEKDWVESMAIFLTHDHQGLSNQVQGPGNKELNEPVFQAVFSYYKQKPDPPLPDVVSAHSGGFSRLSLSDDSLWMVDLARAIMVK